MINYWQQKVFFIRTSEKLSRQSYYPFLSRVEPSRYGMFTTNWDFLPTTSSSSLLMLLCYCCFSFQKSLPPPPASIPPTSQPTLVKFVASNWLNLFVENLSLPFAITTWLGGIILVKSDKK